jgi:hypothetical protein
MPGLSALELLHVEPDSANVERRTYAAAAIAGAAAM